MHSPGATPIILFEDDINQALISQVIDYLKINLKFICHFIYMHILYSLYVQENAQQPDTSSLASSRSTGRRRIREPSDSNDEVAAAAAISLLAAS